jgi:hypothetical protein
MSVSLVSDTTTDKPTIKNPLIVLSGRCIIQVNTGQGTNKTEIPKLNKAGENNVDAFLKQALHLGIMRHGKEAFQALVTKQMAHYDD